MNRKVAIFGIAIIILTGIFVFPNIIDPFGVSPKGTSPNCGPENRYKFDAAINSNEDFVNFIKNNKINERVMLDNFKDRPEGEVGWNKVLNSTKADKSWSRTVYSLDYIPYGCSVYTVRMTNDGFVSVYGCCGK